MTSILHPSILELGGFTMQPGSFGAQRSRRRSVIRSKNMRSHASLAGLAFSALLFLGSSAMQANAAEITPTTNTPAATAATATAATEATAGTAATATEGVTATATVDIPAATPSAATPSVATPSTTNSSGASTGIDQTVTKSASVVIGGDAQAPSTSSSTSLQTNQVTGGLPTTGSQLAVTY